MPNSAARTAVVLAVIFVFFIGIPALIYNSVPYYGPGYDLSHRGAAFVPFVVYPDYSLGMALLLVYFGILIVGFIAIVKFFPKKYTVRG